MNEFEFAHVSSNTAASIQNSMDTNIVSSTATAMMRTRL